MRRISLFLILVFLFASCNTRQENSQRILKASNGSVNYMLIIMKNSDWQGVLGDELRKFLAEPVLGLPQPEAQFDVSQAPPESFGSMFRSTRSVLMVGLGDTDTVSVAHDVYAAPQTIVTVTGTSEEAIAELIKSRGNSILKTFKDADIKTLQKELLKEYHPFDSIKTFAEKGYTMKIPKSYRLVEDDGDFIWYRYHLHGGNSMELISYTLPIESEDDRMGYNIVAAREIIGKKYIPGQIEGSYMITEEAYTPHIFEVELDGKKAFETRGKWEVKDMYMAGPFLSYTIVDDVNDRLIVVEGFTYAPAINKRDFMFELEAILKSVRVQ
jgi:hypothetical protein